MTLDMIIAKFGLLAVFIGAGVEGESTVIGAGWLAREGLLNPYAVALAATAGSLIADQSLFLIGRHYRTHRRIATLLQRPSVARVTDMFERHPNGFILGFRFLYGLRTISPLVIGTTHIAPARFLIGNLMAATLWGCLFTALGYSFGAALEHMVGDVPWYGKIIAFLMMGGLIALGLRLAMRRLATPAPTAVRRPDPIH